MPHRCNRKDHNCMLLVPLVVTARNDRLWQRTGRKAMQSQTNIANANKWSYTAITLTKSAGFTKTNKCWKL